MICWYHRWHLSRAADARRAAPPATQQHLAHCESCRDYAALCARLPRDLAAAAPATPDTTWLEQKIFAQTTRAPAFKGLEKNPRDFPRLGKIAEIFSKPWKAALAAAALLFLAAFGWQQWHAAQIEQRLAALQTMRSLYDSAAAVVSPAALQNHVFDQAQRLVEDAASAMKSLGDLLPSAALPSST